MLVANVRLLPVDSDLAETLRTGSEHFRRRYSVTVAAENAPILRGVVERTLGMLPGVAREADRWGGYLGWMRISGWLSRDNPDDEAMNVSGETIYRTLFVRSTTEDP